MMINLNCLVNLIAIRVKAAIFNGLDDVTQKHCDQFFVRISGLIIKNCNLTIFINCVFYSTFRIRKVRIS